MASRKRRKPSQTSNGPGRGSRVSAELKAKFREAYLKYGYTSGAAREVRLPVATCMGLAKEAEADPEFVKARQLLLSRGLERVEAMLIRSAEHAAERIEQGPQTDAMGGIVDNGPQYFRGLSDAHRALVARRKVDNPDGEREGGPVEVVIRVKGDAQVEPKPDAPPG